MMKELSGQTAIVTGAAQGIGLACAHALLNAGAQVVMADIDPTIDTIDVADHKGASLAVRVDVSCEKNVIHLIQSTIDRFGTLDILINNAAVLTPTKPVHETTIEEINRLVGVNVIGAILCCKHAYSYLAQSGGAIVNVSSMAGVCGERNHAVYAATKGALNALSQAIALDYAKQDIRCNAVCPGAVDTPNSVKAIAASPNAEDILQQRNQISPLGRVATAEEIAAVVCFLASPSSSYITGAVIPVSGGSECGFGVKL